MWLKQCKRKNTASSRFHSVDVLFDLGVCLTWVRLHVWTSVQVTGSQLSGCCFSIGQTVTVGKGQVFFLSVQLHLPVLQASILYSNTKENGSSFGSLLFPLTYTICFAPNPMIIHICWDLLWLANWMCQDNTPEVYRLLVLNCGTI